MTSITKIDDTNIEILKGETSPLSFTCNNNNGQPWDFTDYTAVLQVRKSWNDTSIPPILELSTSNGHISFDTNKILITIPASMTENIDMKVGIEYIDYVYDIDLISPVNTVFKPLRGTFTIYSESTI